MEDKHVLLLIGAIGVGVLFNAQTGFIESETILVLATIGAIIYGFHWAGKDDSNSENKSQISPNEALEEIQDYLESTSGKRKLWLHEDSTESVKLHDRTKYHEVGGKLYQLYGVVGRPVDPNTGEPAYGDMIGVIWNLTKNEFVSSNMELPAALGVDSRIDPFEVLDDWVEEVGPKVNEDDGSKVEQNFYTNNPERGRVDTGE